MRDMGTRKDTYPLFSIWEMGNITVMRPRQVEVEQDTVGLAG